jgi:RimJ/RimL family protein N-acetyltransferase
MKVQAASPLDWHWLLRRVECAITPGFRAIKAVSEAGDILGMFGFDRWTDTSAEIHIAIDNPISLRKLLPEVFGYLFNTCGRLVAMGFIASDNARSLRLARHVGFTEVGRVRDAKALGVDGVLVELRKENCRYLEAA